MLHIDNAGTISPVAFEVTSVSDLHHSWLKTTTCVPLTEFLQPNFGLWLKLSGDL